MKIAFWSIAILGIAPGVLILSFAIFAFSVPAKPVPDIMGKSYVSRTVNPTTHIITPAEIENIDSVQMHRLWPVFVALLGLTMFLIGLWIVLAKI